MRTLTAARWSGALWFLPVLFAGACFMAAGTVGERTGYPTADLSDASICIFLAGPLTGGFVAKQLRGFSRFTRSMRSARSGLAVRCYGGVGTEWCERRSLGPSPLSCNLLDYLAGSAVVLPM